jgi:hypothetical protein
MESQSTTMTTPMTDVDQITADITSTKTDLAEAKCNGEVARRDRLEELLLEQTRQKNLLLANQCKCICMI